MARCGADALPGDVSGPAGREPGRQGVDGRRVVAGGGRHQAVRQGPPRNGRRRTLRGRRRHGDEARRAVGGDRSGRRRPGVPKVLLSPRGAPFSQARGRELAEGPGVVLVCGRFEGVDERVIEAQALEEISVGDFVLSGGEIAAMAVMDCCVRLLPGVMGEPHVGERGEFRGRIAGVSALHEARELDRARRNRTARAGGSGLGPSRQGGGLAEAPAGRDYAAAAARSVGQAAGSRR